MDKVKCVFVPLVFAELYKQLAGDKNYRHPLEDQLATIHIPLDWLGEAAAAYDQKWSSDLAYMTAGDVDSYALTEQHAQFATWVLSGLSSTGDCAELATRVQTAVTQRAFEDIPTLSAPLPPVLSPTIIGWTLGAVVSLAGSDLPVAPAIQPSDDNVRVAFTGLVEHVRALQVMPQPWPEMMQTAMYWRGYGLAEALRPEAQSGGPALTQLRLEAGSSLGGVLSQQIGRHLDSFGTRRNTLSHIADDQSRPRFVDVVDEERNSSGLDLTMRAMTQFVFREVAKEVRSTRPAVVRPGAWDTLEQEIHVWV